MNNKPHKNQIKQLALEGTITCSICKDTHKRKYINRKARHKNMCPRCYKGLKHLNPVQLQEFRNRVRNIYQNL